MKRVVAICARRNSVVKDAEDTAEQSWTIYFDLRPGKLAKLRSPRWRPVSRRNGRYVHPGGSSSEEKYKLGVIVWTRSIRTAPRSRQLSDTDQRSRSEFPSSGWPTIQEFSRDGSNRDAECGYSEDTSFVR